MKMADIQVCEEYVYRRADWERPKRCLVVEKGVHRMVSNANHWGMHKSVRPDGVVVKWLDEETGEPSRRQRWDTDTSKFYDDGEQEPEAVLPRTLLNTWEDHLEWRERAEKAAAAQQVKYEIERAALEDQAALANITVGAEVFVVRPAGRTAGRWVVVVEDAGKAMQAILAANAASKETQEAHNA